MTIKLSPRRILYPKRSLFALIGFLGTLVSSSFAVESFSQLSPFYTNNLTNECSVHEDFEHFGGGYGSFEVNPQSGLELTSEAPNCYNGIKVLKPQLPASHSWQVDIKAHIDLSTAAGNQANPYFSCGLGIVKVTKNCDLSLSILASAPNRWTIAFVNESSVGSYRRAAGVIAVDETADIQLPPLGKEVFLRFRYSADEKILSASYSTDGITFGSLPLGGADADLGKQWNLQPDDSLVVFLNSSSEPYGLEDGSDWWSAFDQTSPSSVQRPEPVYSVQSGEMCLRDLAISYVPSPATDFEYVDYGPAVLITSYLGQSDHVSVPHFLGGKPVWMIGASGFQGKGLSSIVFPSTVMGIGGDAFNNCENLTTVLLPPTIGSIGNEVFSGSRNLKNINLPSHLVLRAEAMGLQNTVAYQQLVQSVGSSLAENELFMAALVSNEKFLGLLTAKLLSRFESYGLAAHSDLANLATKDDLRTTAVQSKTEGVNSVLNDPNTWSLYTTSQIQNMAIGDLLLQKGNGGNFTLYYDIEQSNDLKNWTVYQSYGETISGLPTNKAFLRIRAKK